VIFCSGVTEQPTKAPFFLFGGLALSMAILKTEPMTVIAHKFIGSASVRLAL